VETVDSLQSNIADHFMQNMNNYINYLSFANCATEQEKTEYYKTCVGDLKLSGHWNNDLADCMPFVISNIYSRTVRVFAGHKIHCMMCILKIPQVKNRIFTHLYK
jgi:hypothetical protein